MPIIDETSWVNYAGTIAASPLFPATPGELKPDLFALFHAARNPVSVMVESHSTVMKYL